MWIGSNDFHIWNGTYQEIYNGKLKGAALQAKIDGIVADITTAVDTILAAGDVSMVITTIEDKGVVPDFLTVFPDPAKRQLVTAAINEANTGILAMAAARGIAVVETADFSNSLFGRIDENGYLHVGGELISFNEKGNEPHHAQLDDSIGHAGTVVSGIVANSLFIEPFNRAYRLGITPLTDREILKNAGMTPSPTNTRPVADDQAVTTNQNTAVAVTLTARDADNYFLTFSIVTGPANGTLSGAIPNLTYQPNTGFNGSDSFTFKANDGTIDGNIATVDITVNPASGSPTTRVYLTNWTLAKNG
jgi:hypothetical protein